MNKQCVCYISDEYYFFPSFVSALTARKNTSGGTDILILTTDFIPDKDIINLSLESGIIILDAKSFFESKFQNINGTEFQKNISKTAMGRLVMGGFIPDNYEQIIYIDGDTQVIADLSALENIFVPECKFLAAIDYIAIIDVFKNNKIGNYFNSGVLKFNRNGWIGPDALDYYLKYGGKYHDQGALNAIAADSHMHMSIKWNFPKQFMHLLGRNKPSIVHYTAHPKPWNGVFFPWKKENYALYEKAIESYGFLSLFKREIPTKKYLVYKYRSFVDTINCKFKSKELHNLELYIEKIFKDERNVV